MRKVILKKQSMILYDFFSFERNSTIPCHMPITSFRNYSFGLTLFIGDDDISIHILLGTDLFSFLFCFAFFPGKSKNSKKLTGKYSG